MLLPLFIVNLVLTLADAAVGYRMAPLLMRHFVADAESTELSVRSMRAMLAGVVALYMFFNCLGYFRGNAVILAVVTAVILVDMAAQLFLARKLRRDGER